MPLFTSGGLGLDLVSSGLGLVILVLVVVLRTWSYLHHWYRVSVTDVYVFNNYFARNVALLFGIKQQLSTCVGCIIIEGSGKIVLSDIFIDLG